MPEDATGFFITKFRELLDCQDSEPSACYRPRPYRNAAVRFSSCRFDEFEKRREILHQAGLNAFLFPAHEIPGCDLLSDSGTTTMTMEQWSRLLLGDEAYGSNEGYFELKEQVAETFGPAWRQSGRTENLFIFHQGRAAESALFSILARTQGRRKTSANLAPNGLSDGLEPGLRELIQKKASFWADGDRPFFIIPNNAHFDTTAANIEHNRMLPLDLPCEAHIARDTSCPFRGNMNTRALANLLESEGRRVPLIYLTITNNTGGGQPVSMANIKEVSQIAAQHGIPLLLDACRFAENAWFIQQREPGYRDKKIQEIIHEIFACVDGFHISFKKDGLVNIGGAIMIKEGGRMLDNFPRLGDQLTDHQILTEGHPTYGGLAGRDLKGLVQGLKTVVRQDYLDYRIGQVRRFGEKLLAHRIPIISPVGGHAVYIKLDRFFDDTGTADTDFKGISLTALLLLAGHRFCELGLYAFGKYKNQVELPPDPRVNFVRGAVPRLAYEDRDLLAAAEALRVLHEHRDRIPGVEVTHGRDLSLRHFKSRFRFKEPGKS